MLPVQNKNAAIAKRCRECLNRIHEYILYIDAHIICIVAPDIHDSSMTMRLHNITFISNNIFLLVHFRSMLLYTYLYIMIVIHFISFCNFLIHNTHFCAPNGNGKSKWNRKLRCANNDWPHNDQRATDRPSIIILIIIVGGLFFHFISFFSSRSCKPNVK